MLGASLIEHVDELRRLCGCFPGSTRMCDDCADSVLKAVFEDWQPTPRDAGAHSEVQTAGTIPDELEEPLEELEVCVVRQLNFGTAWYQLTELMVFAPHELTFAARFNVATSGNTQHVTYSMLPDRTSSYLENTS